MSYSLRLRTELPACQSCGHRPSVDDAFEMGPTRNISKMVDLCLRAGGATKAKCEGFSGAPEDYTWCRLHGWSGAELLPIVTEALRFSMAPENQSVLRLLEPDNGWGTLADVVMIFTKLADACRDAPKSVFTVNG